MSLQVFGISASPRAGGNSERLLAEALAGAAEAGAETELFPLRGLAISPCVECNACYKTGRCRIEDSFQTAFAKMLDADRLILATPIFFMAVSAQAKLLIDRCQCLWARKYVLKAPLYPDGPRDRRAMVIAVGGSRSRKMFDSVALTMKYWFDALEVGYFANLFVNGVDSRGDVLEHPQALAEAQRLGRALAAAGEPMPEKPLTVELFQPPAEKDARAP
ncbi:MAG: flavodoxin family protein [Phycisphaerae bacterium]